MRIFAKSWLPAGFPGGEINKTSLLMKSFSLFVSILMFYVLLTENTQAQQQQRNALENSINLEGGVQKSPCISLDGRTMVFMSQIQGKWQVFESKSDPAGTWDKAIPIEAINSSLSATSVPEGLSLSFDGRKLYFSANIEGTSGDVDIFYCEKQNGQWQAPKNIGEPINSPAFDGEPSISADDNIIVFTRANTASEDEDHTCRIIYMAERDKDGKWGKPYPLPSPLNLSCEIAPRILHDNKTLLFSSVREGKKNEKGEDIEVPKGGFDMYMSKLLASNVWMEPVLVNELSSPEDDLYANTDAASKKVVWGASGKLKNVPFGKIYTADLPPLVVLGKNLLLKGKITDLKSGKAMEAKLRVSNPTTSRLVYEADNDSVDGSFTLFFNQGKNYRIEALSQNYSHFFFYQYLDTLKTNLTTNQDIRLYNEVKLLFNIFDKEIFEALESTITVTDENTQQVVECKIENVSKGRYFATLPLGKKYMITASKKNYMAYGTTLDLTGVVQFDEFEKDVELEPMMEEIEIDISDQQNGEGIETEIVLKNLGKNETIVSKAEKGKNGKYTVKLRAGDKYEVNVKNPKGYAYYNTTVDLSSGQQAKKLEVKLMPLNVETNFAMKDITFETNSAELNASSYGELDRAVILLKDNPELKIEISAHTDDIGSDAFNLKLSDKRAKSVVDYMVEKGVVKLRLVPKGYGESKPLVPNTNEESRAKNRRVMLRILGFTTDPVSQEKK
jgi:outer membrane protein OmpA-like peptidoglycan-associated protein